MCSTIINELKIRIHSYNDGSFTLAENSQSAPDSPGIHMPWSEQHRRLRVQLRRHLLRLQRHQGGQQPEVRRRHLRGSHRQDQRRGRVQREPVENGGCRRILFFNHFQNGDIDFMQLVDTWWKILLWSLAALVVSLLACYFSRCCYLCWDCATDPFWGCCPRSRCCHRFLLVKCKISRKI